MSYCSNCGAEIREGFTVCTACGAVVEAPVAATEPQTADESILQSAAQSEAGAAAVFAQAAGYQQSAQPQQPVYQQQPAYQPNPTGYQPYSQQAQPVQPQQAYQPYQQNPIYQSPADNAPYMHNTGVNNQPVQPAQQFNYQQPFGAQQNSQEYYQTVAKAKRNGIVAIIFAFLIPLVSWICGGTGISKAGNVISFAESVGDTELLGQAKKARTLCIIGIVISIVMAILAFANMNQ